MLFDPNLFDPKIHFTRRRQGKVYMYDKAVQVWSRELKFKGCLKDRIHTRKRDKKKLRNIFE